MNTQKTLVVVSGVIVVAGMLAGCDEALLIPPPAPNPFNAPVAANRLTVSANGDMFATEEETLTLTADASGGVPPYAFRWNVELVPNDPDDPFDGGLLVVPDGLSAEIEVTNLAIGRYIYRVRATDRSGGVATDFVMIDVGPTALRASVAELENEDDVLMADAAVPFTLTAEVNLAGDFSYLWSSLSGPEVIFSSTDEETTDVTPLEPGDAVIQLRVRDLDTNALSTVDINVTVEQGNAFLVRVDQPDLVLLNEAGTFSANISNDTVDADSLSYTWELTKGVGATIVSPDARTTEIIGRALDTVVVRVTASGTVNGTQQAASEELEIVILRDLSPHFVMHVNSLNEGVQGFIEFEFDAEAAPKTVASIVRHIDDGFYNGKIWHRLALSGDDPFVAQFGGFERDGDDLVADESTRDSVESEAEGSLGNTTGTLGLALIGGDAGSGTTQIFVNMQDNDFLDDQGFTAFGRVVDGFEIIEAMFDAETGTQDTIDGASLSDIPVDDIGITFLRRQDTTDPDRGDLSASSADEGGNTSGGDESK